MVLKEDLGDAHDNATMIARQLKGLPRRGHLYPTDDAQNLIRAITPLGSPKQDMFLFSVIYKNKLLRSRVHSFDLIGRGICQDPLSQIHCLPTCPQHREDHTP
jgi:hypothetical protein